jgi:hypothetical protein
MAPGGADEALRGRGGSDTAEPDASSESGPGSEAPAGPERDVDIGTPFLGGAANSRRSDEWRYRTISSLGVALDERMSSGRAHQYPIRPTLPDGHSTDHCTLDPPASKGTHVDPDRREEANLVRRRGQPGSPHGSELGGNALHHRRTSIGFS